MKDNQRRVSKRLVVLVVVSIVLLLAILVTSFLGTWFDIPKWVYVVPLVLLFVFWRLLLQGTGYHDFFPRRG